MNKGFVIRKACEEDKRSKNLYLTDKCNGYKEEIFYLLEKWIVSISNGIDRNALEFVIKELQHMAENAKVVDYDKLLEETH